MIHQKLTHIIQQSLPSASIQAQVLPDCEAISLYLINADFLAQALDHEQMLAIMREPAYWVFCWASGQVLANYILKNSESVKGKRVVDFGCGSAVAGIAAKMAGAKEVIACDIDPLALEAAKANAELNQQALIYCDDWDAIAGDLDVILLADVLYDRENLPWLDCFIARAPHVLLADSRVKNFTHPHFERLTQYQSCTVPDLDEFDEFGLVNIYQALVRA